MLGVTTVLTAVDLAMVARELAVLRPHFSEEAHLPGARAESRPTAESEGGPSSKPKATELEPLPESAAGPGHAKPANAGETRTLQAGLGDAVPSAEQLEAELSIVERAPPRKSSPRAG